MIDTIRFLIVALEAYRGSKRTGKPCYTAVTHTGVPWITVFVGTGREAWRITEIAMHDFIKQP